ncbi:MAG: phycobilisome linker polypeptide [Thermostichales cyanobacterium SZTDM-1c_bins_54]
MYGVSAVGGAGLTESGSRVFKIEFTGVVNPVSSLATSDKVRHSVQSVTVPYSSMSKEVQRILRMGGKIVQVTQVA